MHFVLKVLYLSWKARPEVTWFKVVFAKGTHFEANSAQLKRGHIHFRETWISLVSKLITFNTISNGVTFLL